MTTLRHLGKEFTMKGVKDHTCRLIWVSQTQDKAGVHPSWNTSQDPVVYSVRKTALTALEN